MTAYNPLHDPEDPPELCSLEIELRLAREVLDRFADANIHDHAAMLRAAVSLDSRLRSLVAAVEAERGEQS